MQQWLWSGSWTLESAVMTDTWVFHFSEEEQRKQDWKESFKPEIFSCNESKSNNESSLLTDPNSSWLFMLKRKKEWKKAIFVHLQAVVFQKPLLPIPSWASHFSSVQSYVHLCWLWFVFLYLLLFYCIYVLYGTYVFKRSSTSTTTIDTVFLLCTYQKPAHCSCRS